MDQLVSPRQIDFATWPIDIWARIIQLLATNPVSAIELEHKDQQSFAASAEATVHRQYLQLRQLCGTLNHSFLSCQELAANLVICCLSNPSSAILSSSSQIRYLTVFSAPCVLQAVLSQLSSICHQLVSISIGNATTTALEQLSALTTVTTCQLHLPHQGQVDVGPLSALSKLTNLTLQQGEFNNLQMTAGLTELKILQGKVQCLCPGAATCALQELTIYNASLGKVHKYGLSSCSHLKGPQLNSTMAAEHARVLDVDGFFVTYKPLRHITCDACLLW